MTQDDLRAFWHCETPSPSSHTGEQMLAIVVEKSRVFERRIRLRNTVECIAAALVVLIFARLALRAPAPMEKAGFAIVAASAVWIIFCILRFGAGPHQLDPAADLTAYRQMLVEQYDRQIRLLRNVKYWYLLPPYIGILIALVGAELRLHSPSGHSWVALLTVGVVTVVFALIWIANEFVGVRHIERLKHELFSSLEGQKTPVDHLGQ